jgi:hypothetical protein
MSVIQVGLTDKTRQLDPKLVQEAAAALNIQVMRDLTQYWNVTATVRYLPDAHQIPAGVWPVFLVAKLPPNEGGVHLDKKNQPYSLVIGTAESDDWTIDASHEVLEMLVDPSGNRLQTSLAIETHGREVRDTSGQFDYLVEACDPCEGNQYAYTIQGIAVSDFITPHFYDLKATSGTRYSFGGNISRPREILPGGYISFVDTQKEEWEQILFLGKVPQRRSLGPATGTSLRTFVDGKTWQDVRDSRKSNDTLTQFCKEHRKKIQTAAEKRSRMYDELFAGGMGPHSSLRLEPTDGGGAGRHTGQSTPAPAPDVQPHH